VRVINLAGEALAPDLARQVYQQTGVRRLLNLYGPSEDTTYSTGALVDGSGALEEVTIGKPLSETRVYVLDEDMELAPMGATGELYIGGSGLGRGYLGRPELTAEKFVPDPYGGVGERLYRTGDLARWRSDGELLFLGRRDQQVKIRGYRIECGEIEAALREHAAVEQAVVAAQANPAGGQRLVAYVVAKPGADVSPADLRTHLHRCLPVYMIPGDFIRVDSLPLTPSGKLDRKALTAVRDSASEKRPPADSPRDSLELVLRQLWIELLGIPDVGTSEDFFSVGGHSLTTVVLANRIARAFDKPIPVRLIFDRPTIAEQAAFLRGEALLSVPGPLVPIQKRGRRRPVFCVHPFFGLAHCYEILSARLGPDQPFFGLQSHGLEEGQEPFTTIPEMASFYIKAMRVAQPHGPYQVMGWSMGALIAFEIARQLQAQGEEIAFLGIIEGIVPTSENCQTAAADSRLVLEEETIAPYVDLANQELTTDQIKRFARVVALNRQAMDSYRVQPYNGSISLFRTPRAAGQDDSYGWRDWIRGSVDVHEIPGTHYRFLSEPSVTLLARALESCLGVD
jgi:thioesterase domain-containing protein